MRFSKHTLSYTGLLLLLLSSLFFVVFDVRAAPPAQEAQPVALYFFWGEGCPYCEMQKPFLEELSRRYPNLDVHAYEVYNVEENRAILFDMAAALGFEVRGVPVTIIGERHWVGYADAIAQEIEAAVAACSTSGCPDAGVGVIPGYEQPPAPMVEDERTEDDTTPAFAAPALSLYLFFGEGCPQCETPHLEGTAANYPSFGAIDNHDVRQFLRALEQQYPYLQVHMYEVWYAPQNQKRFDLLAAAYGVKPHGVPTIFFSDRVWEGFTEDVVAQIEAHVVTCLTTDCPDLSAGVITQAVEPSPGDPGQDSDDAVHPVVLYFYWGEGCPYCEMQKPFLEELNRRYPDLDVRSYEIYHVEENRALLLAMAASLGFEVRGVPATIIGERYWVGYSEAIAQEIEAYVATCSVSGCPDAGAGIVVDVAAPEPAPTPTHTAPVVVGPPEKPIDPPDAPSDTPAAVINLPLVGTVDLNAQSLWFSTALIAFVDGFNPCSLWVLSILISLTLRTGSRKKVFLTGFVFLFVTSLIYVLFIAGLFTIFTFISFLGWIQVLVALLALLFAGVNIKDYFWYKEGLSFTIADEKKPGIYKRLRKIMQAESLWAMLVATVVMSAGIALVELPCTAGFPVIWTNLVVAQGVDQATFVLLLVLYMLIYLLDELAVFIVAVFTLKSSKLEEKHGRVLKLIGGMLMLTLALVMLINPAWMNEIGATLIIFIAAFGAALLVLLVHRVILPRFGIVIGTEKLE